jgi:ATP-dependent DNA ligase
MTAIAPMEALLAEELPSGPGWQYEPKWDGFRCIAARDGDNVELWSKSGKPLARYFPEVAAMLGRVRAPKFVIDGELLISSGGAVLGGDRRSVADMVEQPGVIVEPEQ